MFDREKELKVFMDKIKELGDNLSDVSPFNFVFKLAKMANYLEDIYKRGYEEGFKKGMRYGGGIN